MTLTRQPGETLAHFKAKARLVNHHLDDRKVNDVLSDARKAMKTYGAMDAFAAIVLKVNEVES